MNALELFCGCGGLSLGLTRAGFKIIAAVDYWERALESYRLNFHHPAQCIDVASETNQSILEKCNPQGLKIDLIAGGPPCQGFSVQRIGSDQDPRNNLILKYIDLCLIAQPRCIIMENVPGIRGKRGGEILKKAIVRLESHDYEISQGVLNAAEYGVPQLRRRFFLIAFRADVPSRPSLPEPTHDGSWITTLEAIGDLPTPPARETATDLLHYAGKMSPLNARRIAMIPPGKGFESLPLALRVSCHKKGADAIGHRNVYGRLDPDLPAGTITARFDSFTRGRFGHPVEPRNITLREGARLQSFPDDFEFRGTQEEVAAQIGNAVPPLLAQALATHVFTSLKGEVTSENKQLNLL